MNTLLVTSILLLLGVAALYTWRWARARRKPASWSAQVREQCVKILRRWGFSRVQHRPLLGARLLYAARQGQGEELVEVECVDGPYEDTLRLCWSFELSLEQGVRLLHQGSGSVATAMLRHREPLLDDPEIDEALLCFAQNEERLRLLLHTAAVREPLLTLVAETEQLSLADRELFVAIRALPSPDGLAHLLAITERLVSALREFAQAHGPIPTLLTTAYEIEDETRRQETVPDGVSVASPQSTERVTGPLSPQARG